MTQAQRKSLRSIRKSTISLPKNDRWSKKSATMKTAEAATRAIEEKAGEEKIEGRLSTRRKRETITVAKEEETGDQ